MYLLLGHPKESEDVSYFEIKFKAKFLSLDKKQNETYIDKWQLIVDMFSGTQNHTGLSPTGRV